MNTLSPILTQIYDSSCGKLVLGSYRDELCLCDWVQQKRHAHALDKLQKQHGSAIIPGHSDVLEAAASQLDEYFSGTRQQFALRTLTTGTEFQQEVWRELIRIPYGHAISYGELAARLGRPSAVRAVAHAVGANAISLFIPCHRVTAAGGKLGGYRGGTAAKRHLLHREGHKML